MRIQTLFLTLTIIVLGNSCRGEAASDSAIPADTLVIRERLRDEILSSMRGQGQREVEERLQFATRPSAVIPNLTYHIAHYSILHVGGHSVVGRFEGRARFLHEVGDWAALTSGWSPQNRAEAETACTEAVEFARTRRPRALAAAVYEDSSSFNEMMAPPDSVRPRMRAPSTVQEPAGTWRVEQWVAVPSQLLRVVCRFERNAPASIVIHDTIEGAGLRAL